MGCEVWWLQSQGRASSLFCSAVPMPNVLVSLFPFPFPFPGVPPPVFRVQHEVPLRRCREARSYPTGWLEDGRLRPAAGSQDGGVVADRDENVAQEGLVDEPFGRYADAEHPVPCGIGGNRYLCRGRNGPRTRTM